MWHSPMREHVRTHDQTANLPLALKSRSEGLASDELPTSKSSILDG